MRDGKHSGSAPSAKQRLSSRLLRRPRSWDLAAAAAGAQGYSNAGRCGAGLDAVECKFRRAAEDGLQVRGPGAATASWQRVDLLYHAVQASSRLHGRAKS